MEPNQVLNKREVYLTNMRPTLNKKAVFSDMTPSFLSPCNPQPFGTVIITIRTGRNNVDYVFLHHGNQESLMMMKARTEELFDYYCAEIPLEDTPLCYYFEIVCGQLKCFYDRRGVVKETEGRFSFRLIPGFQTPKWAYGAVMYQIFTDRFCNGDPTNDVLTDEYEYLKQHSERVENWNRLPKQEDIREFYGGDLRGVMDKLDYLADLGVEVLYFNPLFVSPSSHKYDIQDYDHIDPHFGVIVQDEGELLSPGDADNTHATRYINRVTDRRNLDASNALFAQLVEEAHKRGIRVILDGVFNHCGSFNKWMDAERIYEQAQNYEPGAFVSKESPYHNYFRFFSEEGWPYCDNFDGWWGHKTLPKLNYEDRALRDYIISVGVKWVSAPYNADGWRLDVAADLGYTPEMNHSFWKDFRRAVKNANPEALILAEHYGNPGDWLKGDEWDGIMNYDAFMEPVTWFLTGMQKHSDDFRQDLLNNDQAFIDMMVNNGMNLPSVSHFVSMNELSNHDHSRFLTRTNHVVGRVNSKSQAEAAEGIDMAVMREAVCMQMSWVGAPTIYYGDEAGLCGWTDPDNRRPYPWGNEDLDLLNYHRTLIHIHKECPELKTGSFHFLHHEYGVICYGRFDSMHQSVVVINNTEEEKALQLEVWPLGVGQDSIMQVLSQSTEEGVASPGETWAVAAGEMRFVAPPKSATILRSLV